MSIYVKFSEEELSQLNSILKSTNYYPSKKKIRDLAKSMNYSILKIENWFKYNRRKLYFTGKFSEYKLRKAFKPKELKYLLTLFEKTQNPSFKYCEQIAHELKGITSYQIKNWFANQRRKLKYDSIKESKHRNFNGKRKGRIGNVAKLEKIIRNNKRINSRRKNKDEKNKILLEINQKNEEKNEIIQVLPSEEKIKFTDPNEFSFEQVKKETENVMKPIIESIPKINNSLETSEIEKKNQMNHNSNAENPGLYGLFNNKYFIYFFFIIYFSPFQINPNFFKFGFPNIFNPYLPFPFQSPWAQQLNLQILSKILKGNNNI